MKKRLRFRDLQERKVLQNRVTLRNWQDNSGFPLGQLTGPNTRTWSEEEIDDWLASRPTERKPTPGRKAEKQSPKPKAECSTATVA